MPAPLVSTARSDDRPGNDTSVVKYAAGCKPGGPAELWTIDGGPHIPPLSTSFPFKILDSLFAHPKP